MNRKRLRNATAAALIGLGVFAPAGAFADVIVFKNGDKISGKIVEMRDGKLRISSAVAGEVIVDTVDVATFSTDDLIDVQLADGTIVKQKVEPVGDGRVAIVGEAGTQEVALGQLKSINPRTGWTGNVRGGLVINSGNTNNESYHAAFDLRRRSEIDRYTFGGEYNLERSEDSDGDKIRTTDNWKAFGQYDYFFNEKLYGFGRLQVEHDAIAALEYRIAPSIGLGYQWHESPVWNFSTEAGVAYVYEKYEDQDDDPNFDDDDSYMAVRLAYHYDRKLNDRLLLFHNLEYLPGLDDINNFNLNTDIGLRTDLTKSMFAEFKFEWRHDSQPAAGSRDNDLRYIVAVGWAF